MAKAFQSGQQARTDRPALGFPGSRAGLYLEAAKAFERQYAALAQAQPVTA
jgi:hypothetical protein